MAGSYGFGSWSSERIKELLRKIAQLEVELEIAKRELADIERRKSDEVLRGYGGARG